MTNARMAELVVAVVLLALAVWLYARRSPDRYGSQGAVILFVIAALILIHGLGLMEYRPSRAELGQ